MHPGDVALVRTEPRCGKTRIFSDATDRVNSNPRLRRFHSELVPSHVPTHRDPAERSIRRLPRIGPLVQALPMLWPTSPASDSSQRELRAKNALLVAWLVFFVSAISGGIANAAEPLDESERWVPSFGLYFDISRQKVEGSLTSGNVLGPPLTTGGCFNPVTNTSSGNQCETARRNPQKIHNDSQGNDTAITPLVGGSLELMTPRLIDGFLRPRLFARGDVAAAFGFERNVTGSENPDVFSLPPNDGPGPGSSPGAEQTFPLEELSIRGQGTRARYQIRRIVLSGGAGFAFSLDVFERRLRIKPSLEYLRQEIDLIGVVHRAVQLVDPSGVNLASFRQLQLTKTKKQVQEGWGAGLELEADTARLGPFQTSVYAMGRVVRLIGDLDETLSATNEFGETASWTFKPERLVYRAGVGFRLRWLPE